MRSSLVLWSVLVCLTAAAQNAPRDVDITASDGTKLKATFYAAEKRGPGVMLMHMCNTTRKSWAPVAQQLSAAGINAITVDYRGFGESGGPRFDGASPEIEKQLTDKWPSDLDSVFEFFVSQPGVDKTRMGAGGGSCGVQNAVKLASRHREIHTLVLLAGPTDADGLKFLEDNRWLPIFTAAAADDEYDNEAPELMKWLGEIAGNPRNKFSGFSNGRHGTEIFGPHPELVNQITAWYVQTLIKSPPNPNAKVSPKNTPALRFWNVVNQPGGAAKAAQMFHEARQRDPKAVLFPEFELNALGYERLQAGDKAGAIALFKLVTEAYPSSSNAQDSLSDGYVANGQDELALAAEKKCLDLLPADRINDQFKEQLRQHATEKVAKLKEAVNTL